MTISDLYQNLFGKGAIQDGDVIEMAEHGRVGGVSTGQGVKYVQVLSANGTVIDSFGGSGSALATVTALQGTPGSVPWLVTLGTLSVVTQTGAGALATVTAHQGLAGTVPWLVTMATMPVVGTFSISEVPVAGGSLSSYGAGGSLTAYQGSAPWSVLATVSNSVTTLNAGGSLTAYQGSAPWSVLATISNNVNVLNAGGSLSAYAVGGSISAYSVGGSLSAYAVGGSLTAFQGAAPWSFAGAGGSMTVYPGNVANTVAWLVTMSTLAIGSPLPTGTNSIGTVQPGNTPNTVGWLVTMATISSIGTVANIMSLPTLSVAGNIAHDGVDSGFPIKVGFKAESSTKAITLVADADRTDGYADLDGLQIVKSNTSWGDLISERVSNTDGTSTAFATFDNAAGTRNYITQITVHNSHATTNGYVDIRDGTAGSILYTVPAPATGGAVIHFDPPLRQTTAATALAYDVSAAISTVYISINGFKSKV